MFGIFNSCWLFGTVATKFIPHKSTQSPCIYLARTNGLPPLAHAHEGHNTFLLSRTNRYINIIVYSHSPIRLPCLLHIYNINGPLRPNRRVARLHHCSRRLVGPRQQLPSTRTRLRLRSNVQHFSSLHKTPPLSSSKALFGYALCAQAAFAFSHPLAAPRPSLPLPHAESLCRLRFRLSHASCALNSGVMTTATSLDAAVSAPSGCGKNGTWTFVGLCVWVSFSG